MFTCASVLFKASQPLHASWSAFFDAVVPVERPRQKFEGWLTTEILTILSLRVESWRMRESAARTFLSSNALLSEAQLAKQTSVMQVAYDQLLLRPTRRTWCMGRSMFYGSWYIRYGPQKMFSTIEHVLWTIEHAPWIADNVSGWNSGANAPGGILFSVCILPYDFMREIRRCLEHASSCASCCYRLLRLLFRRKLLANASG